MAPRLNAPFGARCFLASATIGAAIGMLIGLNAPFGARCFLTKSAIRANRRLASVLMHLMALGAF